MQVPIPVPLAMRSGSTGRHQTKKVVILTMSLLDKIFGTFSDKELKRIRPLVDQVFALEPKYQAMSNQELQAVTPALKQRLANGETLDDILPDAYAACREASWRV